MIYLMIGLIVVGLIVLILGVYEIKNAGRCCGDCKFKNKCWSRIDEFTYEHPACERFQEEEYND